MRARRVALVAVAVAVLGGCGSDDDTADSTATTEPAGATTTTGASVPSGGAGEVVTEGTSFSPKQLTVKAGEPVTFTNSGGSHSVTPDDPDGWAGGGAPLDVFGQAGGTYTTTFSNPGEYPYHCQVHGAAGGKGMSGVIVVE